MWIQIRTMDGKKSIQIDKLSKLTTIKELKDKIAVEFGIASERQRLFFSGKQVSSYLYFSLVFNAKISLSKPCLYSMDVKCFILC